MVDYISRLKTKIQQSLFPYSRYCNLCENLVKRFNPLPQFYVAKGEVYGYPYSVYDAETLNVDEYSCPECGCTDRDRLYALYLEKNLRANQPIKLLDIAPSKALTVFIKRMSNIIYRSADLFMNDVDDKVDVMDMHIYDNESFDIFICSHILEHVVDDRKAMRELYRILKPDGFGIAMVPINLAVDEIDEDPTIADVNERWRRFGQDDHIRLYSKAGYMQRLRESGFRVEEVRCTYFRQQDFEKLGIHPRSVLYIVHKEK